MRNDLTRVGNRCNLRQSSFPGQSRDKGDISLKGVAISNFNGELVKRSAPPLCPGFCPSPSNGYPHSKEEGRLHEAMENFMNRLDQI